MSDFLSGKVAVVTGASICIITGLDAVEADELDCWQFLKVQFDGLSANLHFALMQISRDKQCIV